MARFLKSVAICAAVCSLAAVFGATSANAAPKQGLEGAYIGGGFATSNDSTGLVINGRYPFSGVPISIRGGVQINSAGGFSATVINPSVTYDLPVAKDTNVYFGAQAAFGQGNSAFGLKGGAETAIGKSSVIYGDLDVPFNGGGVGLSVGLAHLF
jgi:hypothetical protein